MRVVYVNYRVKRHADKDEFSDFNILTMLMSALKMRSFGYDTKLYCDDYTYRCLSELQVSNVYHEIDCERLNKAMDPNIYDTVNCFNLVKFLALSMETAPVMLMDTDLILWESQAQLFNQSAAVFTHWESVRPVSKWYAKKDDVSRPYGYRFPKTWDFRLPAANTSIMYLRDEEVKDSFCKEALRFLNHNYFSPENTIHPEIYFVEQRLFLMCLQEKGLLSEAHPIKDVIWSPAKGCFRQTDKNPNWMFYLPEREQLVTHTWIAKTQIEKNQKFRDYYCCRLLEEIKQLSPETCQVLERNAMFHNYIRLLNRHGSVEELLRKKFVSTDLYKSEI